MFLPAWHLVYTRPRQESKLASQLEGKIKYYLPKRKVISQWHDRKKLLEQPLFPSYVFVFIDSVEAYYHIMEMAGACRFVKFGRQYAMVSEKIIASIQHITTEGSNLEVVEGRLEPGQRMVITTGPFCGLSCEVHQINNAHKVSVRVNLLNRTILADISIAALSPECAEPSGYAIKRTNK